MKYSRQTIIERIALLRKVKSLRDKGMSYNQIATALKITYHEVHHATISYAKSIKNILLVEGLNNEQIEAALRNYSNGVAGCELINGHILDRNAELYFKALHLKKEHENARNIANVKKHFGNTVEKTAISEPAKKPWDFSDENIVETKRPVLVQVHGKSSGLGYGCAANMCAEV